MSRSDLGLFNPLGPLFRFQLDQAIRNLKLLQSLFAPPLRPKQLRVLVVCTTDADCLRYYPCPDELNGEDDLVECIFERVLLNKLRHADLTALCTRVADSEFVEVRIIGAPLSEAALRLIEATKRSDTALYDSAVAKGVSTPATRGRHLRLVAGKL